MTFSNRYFLKFYTNKFIISDVPKVSTESSSYKAYVGIPVEMLCFVDAMPLHTVVYWKSKINGTVTMLVAGAVGFGGMTLDNPSLTVLNPTESMSGEYTCFSSNVIGTGSSLAIALKGIRYNNYSLQFKKNNDYAFI